MKHIQLDCYPADGKIQLVDHKHRVNVWNLLKREEGGDDEGNYEPYSILTYFPTSEDQVRVFTEYDKQGLIDYDNAIINQANSKAMDQIDGSFLFHFPNLHIPMMDIADMNWYIEEGRIYCEDTKSGITRTFERITIKNKKTGSVIYRYFTLLRNDPVNIVRVAKDIDDGKVLNTIVDAETDPKVGIKIESENVYVLIDKKYNND